MKAVVTMVGPHALDEKERMIILFGETATDGLKEHSVIQQFQNSEPLELKEGDCLKIDGEAYTITHIGMFANSNLNSIAHVTLVFDDVPKEDAIANGVYLAPEKFPTIKKGTVIEYISHGV